MLIEDLFFKLNATKFFFGRDKGIKDVLKYLSTDKSFLMIFNTVLVLF